MASAADVIWFVETYCRVPDGRDVGKPMRLLPFQRAFLEAVFDNPHGTRRAILSLGRKNGKSVLIASLLLAYIVGPLHEPNAQIYSAALSREQSSLIFALMAKMIRLDQNLFDRITIRDSTRELHCKETGVHFRALSAEASTALGTSPLAFVFDELGAVDSPLCDLFDALHSGQAAHEAPIEFVISTQAASDSHFLSALIDDALTGKDPHIVCHLHTAPAECDLLDEHAWLSANPSLGAIVAVDHLRQAADEAQRMPGREPQFRRFQLNQRVEESSPFVGRSVWTSNGSAPKPYTGQPAFAGLDLSSKVDLTALSIVWLDDGTWQSAVHFRTPRQGLADRARRDHADYPRWVKDGHLIATPGATIDLDAAAGALLEILADYKLRALAFDRWGMDNLIAALQRKAAPAAFMEKLQPFGQGYQSMSPAIDALEVALLNQKLAHGNHPVLSMCAANVTIVGDPSGNRKFDKMRSTGRIDGMISLAMAMGMASREGVTAPAHEPQMFFV